MYTINFWPILIATVVGFIISSLWYSPFLFGKEWLNLTKSDKDMSLTNFKTIWKGYFSQLITSLIMFTIVAFIITTIGPGSAIEGAFVGFLAWLGFMIPIVVNEISWRKVPLRLALIDFVNYLIILAIGGAIIGMWM